ncbi:16S rRNA (cytidine(1402)-2'-O)-methyltransferase [Bradymonadaceae bacterium TMQ3]|uniref:Ribosomal RNA small subunit methyltransferase I n=1 Tax=Lujinxingia sediminis TaxID=2480984 RepID=A0ABY0CT41_9DELT|nr:16S rRNA (cytidine(1402)-2'-O)-methyltransferase [Lujinxingia sediminis]RDV38672.1 16S rRNA (cytidine(1402)-2'-O)-methyltransferase [Bradymonadaceae bacterium TMQ3]RVU44776.1 16S rRNA (cytidine(1402)-2'-O)-methyltransferase [Lujinxingia sediminis]TXC76555.1 16S rRNA (cytidine(1402)-2'-O)-methyltransferase [Bradymonadales bacterium TMQ1]
MLVVCPTPIGNLDDVSPRQREALAQADIIACEDTRNAGKLLERLGVARVEGRPKLWRYDDHTAQAQAERLVEELQEGQKVVLISDAGTPTISDPGYRLVRAARQAGLEVVALPGPVAATVGLSASGLASDRFYFEGFLPTRSAARQARHRALEGLGVSVIYYESPRRLEETLSDLEAVCGPEREICVGRELTKRFEEYFWGTVAEVRTQVAAREELRGELVLVVAPGQATDVSAEEAEADRLIEALLEQGLSSRSIKEVLGKVSDLPRSAIYARIAAVEGKRGT